MEHDTIVALATPPGRGGLAVVRLSGREALDIAMRLFEELPRLEVRVATFARIGGSDGVPRDDVVITWFASPASYTGEDVVEISLHGSPLLAAGVVAAAARRGARVARPGDFTLRAFLNGKLDLAQAEAVRDLVDATTPVQAGMAYDQLQGTLSERIGAIERELFALSARLEASVDFPEEGYHFVLPGEALETLQRCGAAIAELLAESHRGRVLRDGATVVVSGKPNVGKSTVFNRLAGAERAIVTAIPGTTRDLVTETVSVQGIPVTLVDTAGARESADPVEREGIDRAMRARGAASLVLAILDASAPLGREDERLLVETALLPRLIVLNKSDLPEGCDLSDLQRREGERDAVVRVSALTGEGFDVLLPEIAERLAGGGPIEPTSISNTRHIELLERAQERLGATIGAVVEGLGQYPEELLLAELQAVRTFLEEITGRRTTEELLESIFSQFCIGK